jgi:predicted NAD/FAD-dependent oxidoreductase
VIGAGLAGLVCGAELARSGFNVTVFDKGRFPGGRLASRDRDVNSFDYGAQYFTAKDERFRKFLADVVRNGSAVRWDGKFGKMMDGSLVPELVARPRYVGVPTMRSVVAEMAGELDLRLSHKVTEVSKTNGKWSLSGSCEDEDKRQSFSLDGYDFLVLNMPPAQAHALYPNSELLDLKLLPCCALLVSFDERLNIDFDGIATDDQIISWAARDSSKPGRSAGERWVIHASPGWSLSNFDKSSDEIQDAMTKTFATIFNIELPVASFTKVHKWRYALPTSTRDLGCIFDSATAIAFCGDWCVAPRVEGAFLSGLSAAAEFERSFAR